MWKWDHIKKCDTFAPCQTFHQLSFRRLASEKPPSFSSYLCQDRQAQNLVSLLQKLRWFASIAICVLMWWWWRCLSKICLKKLSLAAQGCWREQRWWSCRCRRWCRAWRRSPSRTGGRTGRWWWGRAQRWRSEQKIQFGEELQAWNLFWIMPEGNRE